MDMPEERSLFDDLMQERRSVRAFLPDPIPKDELDHIFRVAQLAPSNCNVQPWVVHVVSGAEAERMRRALVEVARSEAPSPDLPLTPPYPGEYRTRQIEAAKALFAATGVERHDTDARAQSFLRNFRFFDAPHAAFIFLPRWSGWREAADCGMFAQSLMLALTAHGFASCAQGALSHYASVVRRELGIGDDLLLLFGIAFGREDASHPANDTRTTRAPLSDAVTFHGR